MRVLKVGDDEVGHPLNAVPEPDTHGGVAGCMDRVGTDRNEGVGSRECTVSGKGSQES